MGVTAVLRPVVEGESSDTIILQKFARGGTFVGDFKPKRDRRCLLHQPGADEGTAPCENASENSGQANGTHAPADSCTKWRQVEAVNFNFSNAFSWFNGKEVEFVLVT